MNKLVELGKWFYQRWAEEFRTLRFRVRMLFYRKVHALEVRSHVF
jgi:hypothetical protein|tara:strand:+ start:142 stop:276 length:135 start_codon:yes stop_codon:yes gene_type:complete